MKIRLLLLTLTTFGLLGCATSQPKVRTVSNHAVGEVDIRSAMFGTGTNVADVTERVIELLRSDKAGFIARGDTLNVDPLPYSAKCLVIDYYYNNKPARFFVVNQQHVSYELLVKTAQK